MINLNTSICSLLILFALLSFEGAIKKRSSSSFKINDTKIENSMDVTSCINKNNNIIKRVPIGKAGLSFDVYFVDLDHSEVEFHHKKENGEKIKNINNLKSYLKEDSRKLLFATNGGMFNANHEPIGLYIEKGKTEYPLNLKSGTKKFTNFYDLPPNGVFFIRKDNTYGIVSREDFKNIKDVKYATQSAPIAILDGEMNKEFNKDSKSKYIRSGVGIVSHNGIMNTYELVFAISNDPVSFYDFSRIFKYYGCDQALYLDGAVSEMYHHTSGQLGRTKTFNDFALMIAVTEK